VTHSLQSIFLFFFFGILLPLLLDSCEEESAWFQPLGL
jgi:hypothetical protein